MEDNNLNNKDINNKPLDNKSIEAEKNNMIEDQFKQLRGLKSLEKVNDKELWERAKIKLLSPDKELEISSLFSNRREITLAKKSLNKYLRDYTPTSVSDKNNLRHLIYLEIIQIRLQEKMNEMQANSNAIPLQMIDTVHKNLREINDFKLKIGLIGEKREEVKSDAFKAFELLKDKFKRWREENQASRTLVCIAEKSKILLPNLQTKNIEDIKKDDEIMGAVKVCKQGIKLVKQKVLNVVYAGEKECVELETNSGRKLICTPDHLIFSCLRSQKTGSSRQNYFPAENCLRRKIKTFNYIDSLHDYYRGVLLGLIESDGTEYTPKDKKHPYWKFSTQFGICQSPKKELGAVEFILNYFNIKYTKTFSDRGWGDGAFGFYISTEFTPLIKEIKNILLLNTNRDIGIGFLAGFILGDGGIDKIYGNEYITQKNKKELLEKVLTNLNINYTIYNRSNIKGMSSYSSIKKQIPLVIPNSVKSMKYLNFLLNDRGHHFNNEIIISVKLLKTKQKVWDITTETQNFIANGLIVHNCPHCGKMIILKIRTDAWEAQKHCLFKDRVLGNTHLVEMYKNGKITREDVAKVLDCSPDYVNWLVDKWNKKDDIININENNIKKIESQDAESGYISQASEAKEIVEVKKEEDMNISAEKKVTDNRCSQCEIGYISCRVTVDGKWEEHCSNCDYTKIHEFNRRQEQIEINFENRRKNKEN